MAKELTELRAWAVEQAVAVLAGIPPACLVKPASGMTADLHREAMTHGGFLSEGSPTELEVVWPGAGITGLADKFLAYVLTPTADANRELLDAARSFDGRQDAGALIGMLADALEQAMGSPR